MSSKETPRGPLSRRGLLKAAGATLSLAGLSILQACAQAPTPTPAPAAKPTEKPAAPAAAATKAPEATKPAAAATKPAAAATKPAEAAKPTVAAKPAAQLEAAEVTWTMWDNPKNVGYEDIVANWSKAQPKVTIKLMPTPDRYEDKVRTMLAAGTPPEIIQVNDDYNYAYFHKGWTRALDDYVKASGWKKEDFYPVIWDFATATGKFTYVTIGNRARGIIFNKDMFDKAGLKPPPTVWDPQKWDPKGWWSWDAITEYAVKLTKREGNRTAVWGAALWTEGRSESTWAIGAGLEGAPYSKDGKKFTLATPEGIKTTQWLADLTCKHKVAPDQAALKQVGYVDMFRSGQLAMFWGNSAHTGNYRTTIKDFKFDLAPVPVGPSGKNPSGISLVGMCIPVKTKFPDQAWAFLEHVMGDDSQKIMAEKAFIPSRPAQGKLFLVPGTMPENNQLFLESMPYGKMENFTENTERARQIYATEMEAVMNCSQTAEAVINKVKPQVELALEGKL